MSLAIVIDTTDLEPLFRELEDLSGKKAGALLRERAGLLGRICAERTVPFQPIGSATGQRESGRRTVAKGVASVYVGGAKVFREIERKIGKRPAKAWLALLRTNPERAAELLRSAGLKASNLNLGTFDGGAAHRAALPTIARRGSHNRPPIIVPDTKALAAYARKQEKRVGWAKSGWITAARQIPGAKGFSKLPAWMKQAAPGKGQDSTRGTTDPYVVLFNSVPYIAKIFSAHAGSDAFSAFEDLIAKDLRAQIDHLNRKVHA